MVVVVETESPQIVRDQEMMRQFEEAKKNVETDEIKKRAEAMQFGVSRHENKKTHLDFGGKFKFSERINFCEKFKFYVKQLFLREIQIIRKKNFGGNFKYSEKKFLQKIQIFFQKICRKIQILF